MTIKCQFILYWSNLKQRITSILSKQVCPIFFPLWFYHFRRVIIRTKELKNAMVKLIYKIYLQKEKFLRDSWWRHSLDSIILNYLWEKSMGNCCGKKV